MITKTFLLALVLWGGIILQGKAQENYDNQVPKASQRVKVNKKTLKENPHQNMTKAEQKRRATIDQQRKTVHKYRKKGEKLTDFERKRRRDMQQKRR